MTGSGMPMRFSAKTGGLIDVYQAATQMTDESGQSYPFTPNTLLDNATGPLGYYGAFTANEHTDSATTFESDQLLASAVAHGVPMVTARQMLSWLDGRNGSSYSGMTWSGNTLSFTVNVGTGANGLTGMVPTHGTGGTTLTALTRAGSPVAFTKTTIKGVEYAMFLGHGRRLHGDLRRRRRRAPQGYAAAAVQGVIRDLHRPLFEATLRPARRGRSDTVAPVIVEGERRGRCRTAPSRSPGPPTRTPTRHVQIGQQPDKLADLHDDTQDTAHTVVATKLQPGSTYYYRVTSVDAAGNATSLAGGDRPTGDVRRGRRRRHRQTAEQFRTVSSQSGTSVQQDGLGEVSLAPAGGSGVQHRRATGRLGPAVGGDRRPDRAADAGTWCSTAPGRGPRRSSGPDARWSSAPPSPDRERSGRASRPAPSTIPGRCSACGTARCTPP